MSNGAGVRWKIGKVEKFSKNDDSSKVNLTIAKKVSGSPNRVIAKLVKLNILQKSCNKEIFGDLKWLEVNKDLRKIKDYLWRWKKNGYLDDGEEGF